MYYIDNEYFFEKTNNYKKMGMTPKPPQKEVIVSTKEQIYRNAILDLLTAPLTLVPTLGGSSLLMFCWAVKTYGVLAFSGVLGVLFGIGIFFSRLIFSWKNIIENAIHKIEFQKTFERENKLNTLQSNLMKTRSTVDDDCLQTLRSLYHNFTSEVKKGNQDITPEIIQQFEAVYQECIDSLQSSFELWQFTRNLPKGAKKIHLDKRDILLEEVEKSVEFLTNMFSEIRTGHVNVKTNKLSSLREELQVQLDTAKATKERMAALEGNRDFSEYLSEIE